MFDHDNVYLFGNTTITSIPRNIKRVFFGTSYNGGSSNLLLNNDYFNLEEIVFAKKSGVTIRNITINAVPNLRSVTFGNSCCRVGTTSRSDGWLTITNLPKLVELSIESNALQDFISLVVSNLTTLETLSTPAYAFQYASVFELSSKKVLLLCQI